VGGGIISPSWGGRLFSDSGEERLTFELGGVPLSLLRKRGIPTPSGERIFSRKEKSPLMISCTTVGGGSFPSSRRVF